ncbi:MAG: DUF6088 family protein [Pseudomonadota bacterium]
MILSSSILSSKNSFLGSLIAENLNICYSPTMVSDQILRKIKSKKRGWVFCAKDFSGISPRNSIYKVLSRMAGNNAIDDNGKIIRLIRGIYYYPILQAGIGIIPPDLNVVAGALARNSGIRIYPSGALSANILGLSNQVPVQNVYWTHGKSMTKHFGKNAIHFKHIRINPAPNTPIAAVMVLNALSYIGKDAVDDSVIKKCSKILNNVDKKSLQKMSSEVFAWIY